MLAWKLKMLFFRISDEQDTKFKAWKATRKPGAYTGALGGRYTFSFTPNGIGVSLTVTDNLYPGSEDLTEYEDW